MPLIGTAGHVDHGKSTLIAALTGRDPDRWAEEKERGLTIDLGFAWTHLGDTEVSFVDVPGHERFLKNMLAGIEPIDVALFVVAADEGWSAQSEEHLSVIDLLGISTGVIALTKVDRVDDDLVELASLEAEERLTGTSLEGAQVVPVSAVRGDGMDALRSALAGLVAHATPRPGPPTLWIDRSFSVAGAGTIVTGTLSGGSVAVGDDLIHLPTGDRTRIRTIQSHETDLAEVGPGRRIALGVPDLSRGAAVRGSVLTVPGVRTTSTTLLVDLHPARGFEDATSSRGAFHVHLGSGDWPATLRTIDERTALVDLDTPIPVVVGDRCIIRDAGRRAVVAGGVVLHPFPERRRRAAAAAAVRLRSTRGGTPDDVADALLETAGVAELARLATASGGGAPRRAVVAGTVAATREQLEAAAGRAVAAARAHHLEHPLRDGIPKAELGAASGLPPEFVDAVIAARPELEAVGATVAADGHRPGLSHAHEAAWRAARGLLSDAGFSPPRASELLADGELTHVLTRREQLVQVGEFLYLPDTLAEVEGVLRTLPSPFTVSEAKDALGISRKHAVPLMEWCDANGVTRRSGDGRAVRD